MRQSLYVERETNTREFVVADLAAAERFWDPLMAFVGWRREPDDGVLHYACGDAHVVMHAGEPWDSVINEANRATPFAHLTFDLETPRELYSLAESVRVRQGVLVDEPEEFLDGGRWLKGLLLTSPNGLQAEVRAPA